MRLTLIHQLIAIVVGVISLNIAWLSAETSITWLGVLVVGIFLRRPSALGFAIGCYIAMQIRVLQAPVALPPPIPQALFLGGITWVVGWVRDLFWWDDDFLEEEEDEKEGQEKPEEEQRPRDPDSTK